MSADRTEDAAIIMALVEDADRVSDHMAALAQSGKLARCPQQLAAEGGVCDLFKQLADSLEQVVESPD